MIDWISFWMIVVTALGLGVIFYFVERIRLVIEDFNRERAHTEYNRKERSHDESYPS